jgi:hypothetical protein
LFQARAVGCIFPAGRIRLEVIVQESWDPPYRGLQNGLTFVSAAAFWERRRGGGRRPPIECSSSLYLALFITMGGRLCLFP